MRITAAASSTDASMQKKMFGSGTILTYLLTSASAEMSVDNKICPVGSIWHSCR